ncbi:MAG: N-acetyl-D-Glu racemase DgcA [Pseudomonadota bacterium]
MSKRTLAVRKASYKIAGTFRISREARTTAHTVIVEIDDGGVRGRGECTPYKRYGETVESVIDQIEALRIEIEAGLDKARLQTAMPPGAARNAIDCALWDLEAKRDGRTAADIAGLAPLKPTPTAFTLSIDTPDAMAAKAAYVRRPLLKLKLAGDGADTARINAVANAAQDAKFILDANEALDLPALDDLVAALPQGRIALIEQPLPADADDALNGFSPPAPLCADESFHDSAGIPKLADKYQAVNIKLDKTGGLTEALKAAEAAKAKGLTIMAGCMLASSLAMAPAFLLSSYADYLDLDGPLLLAEDFEPPIRYEGALMHPAETALWG